jgi:8-oxo-dGTP pyrophosphatase MutT (NUDIX family)
MERIARTAARVLPVSPDGAVLLLQERDPAHPDAPYWSSVGGGVEPGESLVDAAVRELREETGIVVVAGQLLGPLGSFEHEYSFAGRDYVSDNTFFAVPMAREVAVSFAGLVPEEVGNVLGSRWWRRDELPAAQQALEVVGPSPQTTEMMRRAVDAVAHR